MALFKMCKCGEHGFLIISPRRSEMYEFKTKAEAGVQALAKSKLISPQKATEILVQIRRSPLPESPSYTASRTP